MLKYSDKLEKLEPLRKTALVASALEDSALAGADVPPLGRVFLGDLAEERGVPYAAAARSFDPALVERMTRELAGEACAEGARLFVTPDLKTAVDPYKEGMTEDAFLSGSYGAAMVRGVKGAGASVGLSRLSVAASDIAFLDRREDVGAVHELFVQPFLDAASAAPCDAVFLTPDRVDNGYPDTNRRLFSDALNGYFGDVFVVGDNVAPTAASLSLLRGKVSLGGAALPLERAVRRYRQLKGYLKEGSIEERDLQDALRDGSAFSEERLDEAADEILGFAERVTSRTPEEFEPSDKARRELAEAGIVLLKNNGTLPLAPGTRVALEGEAYADLSALEARFRVTGRAQGYERETERSDELLTGAVRAAGEADVALVFLYPGDTERTLALPANRIALLQALKRTKKRIVAVVCGDMPVDMSFDGVADACLLAPKDGPFAAEALARVLSGEADPSGRLARTLYDGTDARMRALSALRNSGSVKMGLFAGYLRYDTAGETVRYPFGYGLSYTTFAYSSLALEGDKISFTVKNTGTREGTEVAQIYVGAPDGTHIVPKKQLKAVCKVRLAAGESKRVTVTLSAKDLATFDPRTLTRNTEAGTYRIAVCSDALTVKLQGRRALGGTAREPSGEKLADYFPDAQYDSAADVGSERRIGRDDAGNVPKKLKNARKFALVAFPTLAIVFFLLMTVLIFSYALDYALFSAIDADAAKWSLYGIAIALLALVPLLGNFNRRRLARVRTGALIVCPPLLVACLTLGIVLMTEPSAQAEHIAMTVISCLAVGTPLTAIVAAVAERTLAGSGSGSNRWAKYYFEHEKPLAVTPDPEFEGAFRAAEALKESRREDEPEPLPPEPEQYFDKDLTYAELLRDCTLYVRERGIASDDGTMRNLLAAFAAAQLAVIPEGMAAQLVTLVAQYFGKTVYVDNAERYTAGSDLFTQWKQAERIYKTTNLTTAIADAKKEGAFLHTVLLRHADAARLQDVFGDVVEALARRKTGVTLPDGTECALPPNLRIFVEIGEGDLGKVPASVAEVAAVLSPRCREGVEAEKKTPVQSVGFARFSAMRRGVRDEFPLGEAAWNNVDALDERCTAAHIGNAVWVRTEVHSSVLAACGADEARALDGALACELLPWMTQVWNDAACGAKLADVFDEIFGRNAELCRELLNPKGDGRAKR